MIRRSTQIAVVAIVLSLLLHAIGLSFSGGVRPAATSDDDEPGVVNITQTFEDIAETPEVAEPPEPEKAPEPEPEEAPAPEPETVEVPTTEVQVASANPVKTFAPDTGSADVVRPDAAGPTHFESGTVPEPNRVDPANGRDGEVSDPPVQPVEPETGAESPRGAETATAPPAEALAAPQAAEPTQATAPEQLAALPPVPAVPVPLAPAAPALRPSPVPVIPLAPATEDPETVEPSEVAPIPETLEAPENAEDAETTPPADGQDDITTTDEPPGVSLRPPQIAARPDTEPEGDADGSETDRSRPPLIESPLTAYRRDGTDLLRQNGGARSGGQGFQNTRGPGNSDVTNYAGRVLVHLNRVPAVRLGGRGWARVFFEINPDGSLGAIGIIEGQGPMEIERAARAQIRAAVPFPLPPNGRVRRMSFVYQAN